MVVKGLKSKNAKAQAVVLLELARIVEAAGVQVVASKGFKEVGKLIESKDSNVRNAALEVCVAAYRQVGSSKELYRLLGGEVPGKTATMIDARLKNTKLPDKLTSEPGRDPSPAHNPLVQPLVQVFPFLLFCSPLLDPPPRARAPSSPRPWPPQVRL